MANSIVGNPWKLDTAGVIKTSPVVIKKMVWRGPTTDADDLDVQSNDGSEIWTQTCIASDASIEYERDFGEGMTFSGFNLVTIDSGALYVFIQVEDFIDGHYYDAPDLADCDDYALQMHAYVKRTRPTWSFGEACAKKVRDIKGIHSLNITLTTKGVYLVEPQIQGMWLAESKHDDIFFVKM
jgi:hypothetical protein